jgi:hypothetical protein
MSTQPKQAAQASSWAAQLSYLLLAIECAVQSSTVAWGNVLVFRQNLAPERNGTCTLPRQQTPATARGQRSSAARLEALTMRAPAWVR